MLEEEYWLVSIAESGILNLKVLTMGAKELNALIFCLSTWSLASSLKVFPANNKSKQQLENATV
jgi:hypothetical protein